MSARSDRVRLPADVELEDRLAFGLTARQLLLLGATALITYALYTLAASALPFAVAAAVCVPVAVPGAVLALGRKDGRSGDCLPGHHAVDDDSGQPRRRPGSAEGVQPAEQSDPRLALPAATLRITSSSRY